MGRKKLKFICSCGTELQFNPFNIKQHQMTKKHKKSLRDIVKKEIEAEKKKKKDEFDKEPFVIDFD